MLIIADHRLPEDALQMLETYGSLVRFCTHSITYDAISCHPDIFICPTTDAWVLAPGCPEDIAEKIRQQNIECIDGYASVGSAFPSTVAYNAVANGSFLIHNLKYTDKRLLELCWGLKHIHVQQAYTRCNLLSLDDTHYITSDAGIYKVLSEENLEVLLVNNEGIVLQGFDHGFFGGCCGLMSQTLFVCGQLNYHSQANLITDFVLKLGYTIKELYKGPLIDGGCLLFAGS